MNNSNNQIAVIGAQAIVKVFSAIGYDCFYETEPEAVINRCQSLATADYKIILILEQTAAQIMRPLHRQMFPRAAGHSLQTRITLFLRAQAIFSFMLKQQAAPVIITWTRL